MCGRTWFGDLTPPLLDLLTGCLLYLLTMCSKYSVDDCFCEQFSFNCNLQITSIQYIYTHAHTQMVLYAMKTLVYKAEKAVRVSLVKWFNCSFFRSYCYHGTWTYLTALKPFCGYCLFEPQRHACSKHLHPEQSVYYAMAGRTCTFLQELPRTTFPDCGENPFWAVLRGNLKIFVLIIKYYTWKLKPRCCFHSKIFV